MTHLFLAISLEKLPRPTVFDRNEFKLPLPHKIDVYTSAPQWLAQMLELHQLQAEDLCGVVLHSLETDDPGDALTRKAIPQFSILIKGICLDQKTPMLSFAILNSSSLSEISTHKRSLSDIIAYSTTYVIDLGHYQYKKSEHYGSYTPFFLAYSNIPLRFFPETAAPQDNKLIDILLNAVYQSPHLDLSQQEIINNVFLQRYRIENDYSFYEIDAFNFTQKIDQMLNLNPIPEVNKAFEILFKNFSRNSHLLTAVLIPFKRALITYGFKSSAFLSEIDFFFEDYRTKILPYSPSMTKDKAISIQAATDLDDLELSGLDLFYHISKNKSVQEISRHISHTHNETQRSSTPLFEIKKITQNSDHLQITIKMATTFNIHYKPEVIGNFQKKLRLESINMFFSQDEKVNLQPWFSYFSMKEYSEISNYFSRLYVSKELFIILRTSQILALYSNCETDLTKSIIMLKELISDHPEFKNLIIQNILWNQSTHFPYQLKLELLKGIEEMYHPEADLFFDFDKQPSTLKNKKNIYPIFETLSEFSFFLRKDLGQRQGLPSFFETLAFLVFSEQWIGPGHDEKAGTIANIAKDVFLMIKHSLLKSHPGKKSNLESIESNLFKTYGLKSVIGEMNKKSLSIAKEEILESPQHYGPKHPRGTAAKLVEKEINRIRLIHDENELTSNIFLKIKSNLPYHQKFSFEEDYFHAKDKHSFLNQFMRSHQEQCLLEINSALETCHGILKKPFEQKTKHFIDAYKYAECIKFSMDFKILIANINIVEKLLKYFEPDESFQKLREDIFNSFSTSTLCLSNEYNEHTHETITESMNYFVKLEMSLKKRVLDELDPTHYTALENHEIAEMQDAKRTLEHDLKYHHYLDNIVFLKAAIRASVCEKRKNILLSMMHHDPEKTEFNLRYISAQSVQEKITLLNLQQLKILADIEQREKEVKSKLEKLKECIITSKRMHSTGDDSQIKTTFNEDEKTTLLSIWSGYQGPETELKIAMKLRKNEERAAILKSAFNLSQTPSTEEFKKFRNKAYIIFRLYCVSFYLSVIHFLTYFSSYFVSAIKQIKQEQEVLQEQILFLETHRKEILFFSQSNFDPQLAEKSASVFTATETCLERLESNPDYTLKDAPEMQHYFSNFNSLKALEDKRMQVDNLKPLVT